MVLLTAPAYGDGTQHDGFVLSNLARWRHWQHGESKTPSFSAGSTPDIIGTKAVAGSADSDGKAAGNTEVEVAG